MIVLLEDADSAGSAVKIWRDSELKSILVVDGTLDGATVALQLSPDGGSTWVNVQGAVFEAAEAVALDIPNEALVRGYVWDAGASTEVNMRII